MPSLVESVKSIFSKIHPGTIVGVDIGTSSIKVVEIQKEDERAVLRNYGEIALGPLAGVSVGQATSLPPEKLAQAMRDLLHETGIISKHISFAIPFSSSLLVIVKLPDVGDAKLESMVPLEARRYIPVPLTEVSLNWWALPKRKEGEKKATEVTEGAPPYMSYREVIIAAVHNDVFKKYDALKRDVGLIETKLHFEMEIFSVLRSTIGRDLAPMVVLDIGAGTTKLVVVEGGVVRGSHIISMGGQDITLTLSKSLGISFVQAEEMKRRAGILGTEEGRTVSSVAELLLANMFNEVKRVVENYERQYEQKIQGGVLVGGGALLKGIANLASAHFPNMKIVIGDPFSRVESPAFMGPTLRSLSPNFAIALGIALKGLEE